MNLYQTRKDSARVYVLLKNGQMIGVYGSLRKLCAIVNDKNMGSYWTLIRNKEYPIESGGYVIHKTKVH